jgi:hypothetical protein
VRPARQLSRPEIAHDDGRHVPPLNDRKACPLGKLLSRVARTPKVRAFRSRYG